MSETIKQPTGRLKTPTLIDSSSIKNPIKNNRTLISLISAAFIATGCGGSSFETENDMQDAGPDQPQDSAPDTNQDALNETTTDAPADTTQETTPNPDAGCTGTELTFQKMKGYEILHTGSSCNDVKLDTTKEEGPETNDLTICVHTNDKIVAFTHYTDGENIHNDLNFTTTTTFSPSPVRMGGITLVSPTPVDGYYMHSLCIKELQNVGTCVPQTVENINLNQNAFTYPGNPNCSGATNPDLTANLFYFIAE